MYLTYTNYQTMGGTLTEATFNDFEFEAETIIDWYTFNRLKGETEYPFELSKLMYVLIKLLVEKRNILENATVDGDGNIVTGSIASQSNDGVSISYNVMSAKTSIEKTDKEIESTITRYLSGVKNSLGRKLLYRGLYPGE